MSSWWGGGRGQLDKGGGGSWTREAGAAGQGRRGQLDKGGGALRILRGPAQPAVDELPETEEGLKEGSDRLQEAQTEAGAQGRLARPQVIADHTPRLQDVPGMQQRQVGGGPHRGHEAGHRRPARARATIASRAARDGGARDCRTGPLTPGPTGRRTGFCTLDPARFVLGRHVPYYLKRVARHGNLVLLAPPRFLFSRMPLPSSRRAASWWRQPRLWRCVSTWSPPSLCRSRGRSTRRCGATA